MGAGKTTVGRLLAARLRWPFVDTDEVLAARHGPVAAQLREGEGVFRAREAAVIAECCDGKRRVLATGGGAFVDPDSRRRLLASYVTVHLEVSLPEVARRLVGGPDRPLFDAGAPARWQERQAAYAEAHLHVSTAERAPQEVVDCVLMALEEAACPNGD